MIILNIFCSILGGDGLDIMAIVSRIFDNNQTGMKNIRMSVHLNFSIETEHNVPW